MSKLEFSDTFRVFDTMTDDEKLRACKDNSTARYYVKIGDDVLISRRYKLYKGMGLYRACTVNAPMLEAMHDKYPQLRYSDIPVLQLSDRINVAVDKGHAAIAINNNVDNDVLLTHFSTSLATWISNIDTHTDVDVGELFAEHVAFNTPIYITRVLAKGNSVVLVVDKKSYRIWGLVNGKLSDMGDPSFQAAVAKLQLIASLGEDED